VAHEIAAATSTPVCPASAGSMHQTQVEFQWEGSSETYDGSSTLMVDASPLMPIGEIKARIPEASDAGANVAYLKDGADGDVNFQFNNLKPIATVGEVDYKSGMMIVGVPDGLGAMLADDTTVRCIVQSESYGPIARQEAHPYMVNNGAVAITGSHVQYVDYDREMMSTFMTSSLPASSMVTGAGNLITKMYNLKGELVGRRSRAGPTIVGAMDSNVDEDGNYVLSALPKVGGVAKKEADWTMMSLCSAQLAKRHMWGDGVGFENDIFLTNEEWQTLNASNDKNFIGLPGHAIDIAMKTSYAWGAGTVSGFEKPANFNSEHPDYVVVAISGYNGAYNNHAGILAAKRSSGARPDGNQWVYPQNICPARIYIGRKGYNAKGELATDFLSRNGLAYGQVYGFATNSSAADFADRDAWHKTHHNGDSLSGKFYPIDWRWNGTVRNFDHDGAWHFQLPPKGAAANYVFWNAKGNSQSGSKTEHVSPDPTGAAAFFQTSTAGYFGKYIIDGLGEALVSAATRTDPFPSELTASYHLFQGETPINNLIDLGDGSKGQCANGMDQQTMCDGSQHANNQCGTSATLGKLTFEDIDGFEALGCAGNKTYSIIQEDGGNYFGERMFIYENRLTYGSAPVTKPFKLIAQSGGKKNSRMLANVGVPAGTNSGANSHEFSGVADLSGLLVKQSGTFILKASDPGYKQVNLAKTVDINDKLILIGLQAHNLAGGVISTFGADRGGQWLLYQPRIEGDGVLPTETSGVAHKYPCNPFSSTTCHIHPGYKVELDTACGAAATTPGTAAATTPGTQEKSTSSSPTHTDGDISTMAVASPLLICMLIIKL